MNEIYDTEKSYQDNALTLSFSNTEFNLEATLEIQKEESITFPIQKSVLILLEMVCIPMRWLSRSLAFILAQLCQGFSKLNAVT